MPAYPLFSFPQRMRFSCFLAVAQQVLTLGPRNAPSPETSAPWRIPFLWTKNRMTGTTSSRMLRALVVFMLSGHVSSMHRPFGSRMWECAARIPPPPVSLLDPLPSRVTTTTMTCSPGTEMTTGGATLAGAAQRRHSRAGGMGMRLRGGGGEHEDGANIEDEGGDQEGFEGGGVVTAFEVKGAVDYAKLVREFGSQLMDSDLIERLEKVTGRRAHHLIRRGFVFSHRDLGTILDMYEAGTPFFLYTGRGPSSSSMHIGHLIPFMLTKWLQEAFQVPLVVQLTDDEKFLWKGGSLDKYTQMAMENARDIAAFGLDPRLTFMFIDTESIDMMYPNVLRIQRQTTCSQVKGIFGVTDSDSMGKMAFPAVQAAPCFSSSLPEIFPPREGSESDLPCLVPCAIDQDPYFRMTRHVAAKIGKPKPALIHCKFIPALQGDSTKMSASETRTAIYLTDPPKEIRSKINKMAFSGGGNTIEEHRANGGNTATDVSYRYLEFFHDDDEFVASLGERYRSGEVLSGEMKAEAIKCIQRIVEEHACARSKVDDDMLAAFMKRRPLPLPK